MPSLYETLTIYIKLQNYLMCTNSIIWNYAFPPKSYGLLLSLYFNTKLLRLQLMRSKIPINQSIGYGFRVGLY